MSTEDIEDTIDARGSQGFVKDPTGSVEQQYGDRQNTNTQGGDVATRDIDKRSTINNFTNYLIVPEGNADQVLSSSSLQGLLGQLGEQGSQANVQKAYQSALPDDTGIFRPTATDNSNILAQLQEFNKLRDFVTLLAQDPEVPQTIREKLTHELEASTSDSSEQSSNSREPLTPQKLVPYLMVVLCPVSNQGQFLITAWLIPDVAQATSLEGFKPLDLDETQKGTACTLDDIPNILDQFLKKSREWLRGQKCHKITLEVFLPLEYLGSEVEHWQVSLRRNKKVPVGAEYPIVLRSYERLELEYLDYYWNDWQDNWDQLKAYLSQPSSQQIFHKLDNIDNCDWGKICYEFREEVEKVGFIIPCLPPEEQQEDLFNTMIDASVPIALWFRRSIPDVDCMTVIHQLLAEGPLHSLPECIRKVRYQACALQKALDQDYAHNLSILWEDPNRLPPDVMIQLQPPE